MQPARIPSRVHFRFEPCCWDCPIACQEPNSLRCPYRESTSWTRWTRRIHLSTSLATGNNCSQGGYSPEALGTHVVDLFFPWCHRICRFYEIATETVARGILGVLCYCMDAAVCGARADGSFHMYDLWWPSSFGWTVARRMIRSKATMFAISTIGEVGVGSGKRNGLLRNPSPVACRNQRLWLTGMPAQDL